MDETPLEGETAEALVRRLARLKAWTVACGEDELVLAADTTVACEGEIMNKPEDPAEATACCGDCRA